MNKELLYRYGIVEWYTRQSDMRDLYSNSINDPALLAECDGFELCKGRPFHVNVLIGEWDKVTTQLIIFDCYTNKVKFLSDEIILTEL